MQAPYAPHVLSASWQSRIDRRNGSLAASSLVERVRLFCFGLKHLASAMEKIAASSTLCREKLNGAKQTGGQEWRFRGVGLERRKGIFF